jgi:hypothetical protein
VGVANLNQTSHWLGNLIENRLDQETAKNIQ